MKEVTALRSLLTFGEDAAGRSSANSGQPAARASSDRPLGQPSADNISGPAADGSAPGGNPPFPDVGEKQHAAVHGGSDAIPSPGAAASQLKSTAGARPAGPLSAEGTLCRAK